MPDGENCWRKMVRQLERLFGEREMVVTASVAAFDIRSNFLASAHVKPIMGLRRTLAV